MSNDLRTDLEKVKYRISQIQYEIHWLNLPKDLRDLMSKGLSEISLEELAQILVKPKEVLEHWQKQISSIEKIKGMMKKHQEEQPDIQMFYNNDIVDAVIAVKKGTSCAAVARALDDAISDTTIKRWIRSRSGIKEKKTLVQVIPAPSAEENPDGELEKEVILTKEELPLVEEEVLTIEDSSDARKLSSLIIRHEGKTRRKYSPSEKRLILSLQDRFGAKSVHDKFKVSYDTLSRLKRRHAAGEDLLKPRVPIGYAPVVELMNKYPGAWDRCK